MSEFQILSTTTAAIELLELDELEELLLEELLDVDFGLQELELLDVLEVLLDVLVDELVDVELEVESDVELEVLELVLEQTGVGS